MAKIFISHSSEDNEIIGLFKNMILNASLGISDNDIAYTSAPETGVPTGGNIPQYIKERHLLRRRQNNTGICLLTRI